MAVPTIKLTRTIDAPVEKVFQAWTDPLLMPRWFAPEPFEITELNVDARKGGRWMSVVAHGDDGPHKTSGEYLELEPNRRLVKTWSYEGPHGDDTKPSVLTVDFKEIGSGVTELTLTHEKIRDEASVEGATEGWMLILERLESYLEA